MLLSDDQRVQAYTDRTRLVSGTVERCAQELIDRVRKANPIFDFDLLAPPISHLPRPIPSDQKEIYNDFYLVWKNVGRVEVERDDSSVCCQIKYIDRPTRWSRAEAARLLLHNVHPTKKRMIYLNGRALRDLLFETLLRVAPDLIRLDFVEHLIYFDLIIPFQTEKLLCHVTYMPCLHRMNENEVLLPFGTLRWYPRSLATIDFEALRLTFQPILQNITVRHFISTGDTVDETSKISKKDQQEFARVRTILHELIHPSTLEHLDSIEQLQRALTDGIFFLPHRFDRNCDVFPAGQHLIKDLRARRFFGEFLRHNAIVATSVPTELDENSELK